MRFLTYAEEMREKYPNRPYVARPTWELSNMARALSMMAWSNTPEEDQRLKDVKAELSYRRKAVRQTVNA